ncbi:hypothetical protein [Hymenobacter pini]|uniref:hypothetical protein n=1 Tax=Hymenobacter pini TaxID=2880879 RepID=UPI001CF5139C|nr:hypothetical protein [Hymenobacter pini]MCA8830287.1 hypothetical protein [Hymenobacter pini]
MQVFTQPYEIQLTPACPARTVYLRWLSPLGNWEGWGFTGDTDDTTQPEADSVLRTASGSVQVLQRTRTRRRLLRAGNLTPAQHEALTSLLDSPQVYVQNAAGQLTPVLVVPAAAGRTSSATRTELDVEIELPASNALTRI